MGKQTKPKKGKATEVKMAKQKRIVNTVTSRQSAAKDTTSSQKRSSVSAPKSDVATQIMNAPGMAFAKGMGYILNTTEKYGKSLGSRLQKSNAPAPLKPKSKNN